jgi:large subunit ribosomal protein L14
MIQMRSILDVADNSGRRKIAVINPIGGSIGRYARLGDLVTASVKEAAPDGTVKKGRSSRPVIVRMRKEQRRRDGSYIRFDRNAAVLGQRLERADRHPRLRPGRPRAARAPVHEDHLARRRKCCDETLCPQERRSPGDRRTRSRQARPRACACCPTRAAWSSRAST